MDLSVSKYRSARAFMALLTLTAGAGALHATNSLTATVSSGSVTCNIQNGPGSSATITVKAGTALVSPNTITVSVTSPGGGLSVTPTVSGSVGVTLNSTNNSSGVTFTVASTAGCGAGSGAVVTSVQFTGVGTGTVGAVTSGSVNVTDTVSSNFSLKAVVSGPITCNTATGPGAAATITISPFTALTGSNTIAVGNVSAGGGLVLTPPNGGTTLSTSTTSLVYTVSAAAGCVGNSTGPTIIQFTAASVNDVTATVTDTVTASASALVVSPSPITIRCVYAPAGSNPAANAGNYTPGAAQTVSITSAATGGTPFTIDNSSLPSWVSVNSSSIASSATATPTTFTVVAAAGCGLGGQTTHTGTIHLTSNPNVSISITLQNVFATPLTVTPVPAAPSITLSYTKGSGNTASANVSVTSTVPSVFVTINTATLPSWLTVDNISGTAPWSLRFSTTTVAASLAPGTYSANVSFQVSGYSPLSVPVTLQVNNTAPKLSVSATSVPLNWTLGAAIPTYTVTATSTDSPIQYAITSGGTLAPSLVNSTQQSGLAYSFGTQIPVTFNPAAFATAQPGQILTGTLTFTWGNPASTTVITFLVTVQSPGATLTGITPATLPTAIPGTTFTLNLTGTGFVGGTNATLATRIGIVGNNNTITTDTNLALAVVNPSNMTLTITVPTVADANLPFNPTGNGGTLTLGIVNGNSSNIATGTAVLTIGVGPIIQGVTSSSSFTEVTPPTLPTFAPYDMITLWGSNFCSSNNTGCGTNTILTGSPDALTLRYPTTLSLPAPDVTGRLVSVQFFQHGQTTGGIAAPLLFATNGQINLIVPAGVSAFGGSADIVAYFGFGSGNTLLSSAAFQVNIGASDPGIFTVGADGQGAGAILDASWNLINSSNQAGMRSGGSDSDTIQIFVTGLGAPDSAGPSGTPSTPCIPATSGTGNYMGLLQTATSVSPSLTSIDGAVVQASLLPSGGLPPCFTSNTPVTVTVGGQAATVTYAGFVGDVVAGLYQINAQLPPSVGTFYPNYPTQTSPIANITAPVQLPVQVTVNSVTSQTGVTVWVAPRLNITASNLTNGAVTATVGVTTANLTTISATEGTGTIQYTLTSGFLPAGLTLNGATGVISGRPAANTSGSSIVTVTGTDSASTPVTGSVTFTIVVGGGLYLTSSGTAPYSATFGTANATVTTVTATGGKFPYTYAMTFAGSGTPTGLTINTNTGVISTTAATLAGSYNVTVTATDSAGTPVTGNLSFTINVALHVTQANGSGSDLKVVTVTGNSGTVTYTLDAASVTAGLLIDSSGNITKGSAGSATYPVTVTVNDTVTLAAGATAEGTGNLGPFNVVVP
jgi:hypothetical protein